MPNQTRPPTANNPVDRLSRFPLRQISSFRRNSRGNLGEAVHAPIKGEQHLIDHLPLEPMQTPHLLSQPRYATVISP